MMQYLFLLAVLLAVGCAPIGMGKKHDDCSPLTACIEGPQIVPSAAQQLLNLPPPNNKAVVAVYSFTDKTSVPLDDGPSGNLSLKTNRLEIGLGYQVTLGK